VARLRIEHDESVREIIFTTLTRIGDRTAVDGLVEFLRSEDAALRNEAIEAMKQLPDAVANIMQGLLVDADSDVRIFAVNILESLRHPDVERWLSDVIERDAHVNVCATAVDLLGEVGSRAALEPLLRLKSRFAREPYIQFAADLAIKRILEG
jgi:HEAT repeat protein